MAETTIPTGQIHYEAYAAHTGWKTFDGRDMPPWSQLGDRIQGAWQAAAAALGVDVERLERLAQYRRDHEGIYCRLDHHTRLVDLIGNPNDEDWTCAHCALRGEGRP